ncbi:putative T7SS-secreted protein [Blastococcus saxobsidens]
MYGDPDALDALAAELTQRAREVRAAGEEHRREGDRAHWVSEAASAYRRQLAQDCAAVDAAADEMEQAADELRRHADEVRDRLAAIARAEQAVRSWLADQAARGGELLDDVGDVLGALPEAGADAWRSVSGQLSRLGLW